MIDKMCKAPKPRSPRRFLCLIKCTSFRRNILEQLPSKITSVGKMILSNHTGGAIRFVIERIYAIFRAADKQIKPAAPDDNAMVTIFWVRLFVDNTIRT